MLSLHNVYYTTNQKVMNLHAEEIEKSSRMSAELGDLQQFNEKFQRNSAPGSPELEGGVLRRVVSS